MLALEGWHGIKGSVAVFFRSLLVEKECIKLMGDFFVVFPLLSVPSMVSALDW